MEQDMATFYSAAGVGVDDGTIPFIPGSAAYRGGPIHALVGTIDLAANAVTAGDIIDWGPLHKGIVPIAAFLITNVTFGATATIDLGTSTTAALFRAAGTLTTTDAPVWSMKGANALIELAAGARLQSVIAAANLPTTTGTRLSAGLIYTMPHGA